MEINITKDGNKVTVAPVGTIDTETAPQLGEALLPLDYGSVELVIDFKNVKYITSAGLRVLLIARKKLTEDTMKIINVREEIAEVFEVTGFSVFLNYKVIGEDEIPPENRNFKTMLKERAKKEPDKTAFVYAGREYSWGDIEKASQIIALDLSKTGVKKGTHVGICGVNSINWVFAFFAIQKLGGIAVLMNYGLKPEEIKKLSKIGDITHLCCGIIPGVSGYEEYVSAVTGEGSVISETFDIGAVDFTARYDEYDAIKDKFGEVYNADDAGLIIFTSGSTGTPKAVLSSPHNMLDCLAPIIKDVKMSSDDRNCAFLPFFHIFGFATAISVGILTNDVSYIPLKPSPSEIIAIIDKYKCTMFHSVPTMMLAILQCPDFAPEKVASVRSSILGGAATTEAQMLMLQKAFPNNHFGNIYGMSENAAVSITKYEDSVEHITKTIGKPLDGVEVEIRDLKTSKKAEDGVSGEICIRSENMIVCYYKLDISKQPVDDEGWLATGDIGYVDPDGYLKLSGRVKELIIRGGENISPNEVAGAIAAFPGIADVKVLGVPSEFYGEEVAAAVVLKDGEKFDEEKIREYLSSRLAKFKVPKYFFCIDAFPLLGSGKVDAISLKNSIIEKIKNME